MEESNFNTRQSDRETDMSGMASFLHVLRSSETISEGRSQSNSESQSRQFCNEGLGNFLDELGGYNEAARLEDEEMTDRRLGKSKKPAKSCKQGMGARIINKLRGRNLDNTETAPTQGSSQTDMFAGFEEKFLEHLRLREGEIGLKPSPYVSPLEYDLAARDEVANVNPSSEIVGSNSEAVIGITKARHRGRTAQALFGPFPDENACTTLKSASKEVHDTTNESDYVNFQNTTSNQDRHKSRRPLKIQECMRISRSRHTQEYADSLPEQLYRAPPQSRPKTPPAETYEQYIENYRKEELDRMVLYASPDTFHEPMWRQYLESYTDGHYNLISPPDPPTLSPGFLYLPARLPAREMIRYQMSREYDILWTNWGQEQANEIIRLAMTKFGTNYVSLSFFDETDEICRAGNGYNRTHLHRPASFAAHCLFSKDVLVLLDTKQDWRFEKNPLVLGPPNVRFWAGAPMMSPCGEVLGVFAVFSAKPRTSFTPEQRRGLAEFASLVMQDLKVQADALTDSMRLTPLLDRDSFEPARHTRRAKPVAEATTIDPDMVPNALSYPKDKTPKPQQSRGFLNRESRDPLLQSEQTPPSSAESNHGFFDNRSNLRTPDHFVSGEFGMNQGRSFNYSMASYPSGVAMSTHRPWSDSDLTSVCPHPPNTPVGSFTEHDLSTHPNFDVEEFNKLTDEDCAEPLQDSRSSTPKSVKGSSTYGGVHSPILQLEETNTSCDESQQQRSRENSDNGNWGTHQRNARYQSEKFLARSKSYLRGVNQWTDGNSLPQPLGPVHSQPPTRNGFRAVGEGPLTDFTIPFKNQEAVHPGHEQSMVLVKESPLLHAKGTSTIAPMATFVWSLLGEDLGEVVNAYSDHCQDLGYDLVYIVEIKPARQFMSEAEVVAAGGLHERSFAVHGPENHIFLDSATHLRALRSRGGEYWSDPAGVYQSGRLIGIHFDAGGPTNKRSSGIVLVALRKSGRAINGQILSSATELARLTNFGRALKKILRPAERVQTRSNIDRSYTANEAGPVYTKTQSFDTSRRPPY